jgi:aryl carrier-like protein
MYRTGDFGRYLSDGSILLHGRKDHQVKIRGNRIEPGEIETVLLQHPNVRQAVVVPRVNADGQTNIFAYFVAANGFAPLAAELRAFLKRTLPSYMLPLSFTELAIMPMTSNLKIDRRALPDASELEAGAAVEAEPKTDLERTILDIWKNLLVLDRVALDDNFFDIGGHSLQLVRLRSRLRKATGRDVSVLDLFTHTTIRSLVGLLSKQP